MAVRTRAGALNFCTPLPGVGDSLLCPPRSLPGFTMLSSFLTVLRES